MFCKKCGKELNKGANVCPKCGTKVGSGASITQIFNSSIWRKENESNDYDCFVGNIPEDVKNNVRNVFGINYNEQILFVRDSSFWNSRDQGLVLTDGGLYCIPDNDKPDDKIYFTWSDVARVEYKDMCLYFSDSENNICPIHISYFMKSNDNSKARRLGNVLANNFTQMAQSAEPEADPLTIALEQYDQFFDTDKEQAYQFALSCMKQEGMEVFYILAAQLCLSLKKDYPKTISLCNDGLQYCEQTSRMEIELLYTKYSAYQALNNLIEARKYCLPVMLNAPDDMLRGDGVVIKDDATTDFTIYEDTFSTKYLEQPYNKRKILLPVNEYTDLNQEYLSVLDINKLPDTHIEFPIGHPVAYQLYIGHPYIKQKYIPFENHELELLEDKVREFCQIVQGLGATEIAIECVNSSSSDNDNLSNQNVSGNASYKVVSASASSHNQSSRHLIEEISKSINLHQRFIPQGKPELPENLVWFPNEPSWQRLYEQRMKGSLLQHEERIETRKNRVFENNELNSIEGEFKSLFMDAKGQWDKKYEEKFTLQDNAILSIKVYFASLEEGENEQTKKQSSNQVLTENEKEYVEELKICFEEDGEISPRERRLLDRLRTKLLISEIRAKELEESLRPQLSEKEQEYIEEYKACLEECKEISSKEKRLLDKLRVSLGITEERAKEIENYY